MSGAIKGTAVRLGPRTAPLLAATPYFLPLLLALLLGWSRFCFRSFGTVGLAISGAEFKGREVTIGFSGCSL